MSMRHVAVVKKVINPGAQMVGMTVGRVGAECNNWKALISIFDL
jgi:hypothetical protein